MSARPKPYSAPPARQRGSRAVTDESGHTWAISYADVLMVLLCYFILFFSADQTRESILEKIIATPQLSEIGSPAVESTESASVEPEVARFAAADVFDSVQAGLSQTGIKTQPLGQSLLIVFPDNVYGKRRVNLPRAHRVQLEKIFEHILPYKDHIEVVLVGHTDSSRVVTKTARVRDNLDLSSERANRALLVAARMGFPIDRLRSKASSQFERSSRSLSIEIIPREAKP
jgi:flagellar motor protein MotB